MNMKVIAFEKELVKNVIHLRKQMSGKGPLETHVHVSAHTIYMRLKVDYTPLEATLLKLHPIMDFSKITDLAWVKDAFQEHLAGIFPDITVIEMLSRPDPDRNSVYLLVVLDRNIEKILRTGKA
jgi:uncharacterized protein YbcI